MTLDCFLCIGMTLVISRTKGNCPAERAILKITLNWWEMSFFRRFKFFTGILFGPDDFWEFSEDIIKYISFLSVGVKRNVSVLYKIGSLCF